MTAEAGSRSLRELILADLAVNRRHRGIEAGRPRGRDVLVALGDVRFLPVVLVRLTTSPPPLSPVLRTVVSRAASLLNRFVFGIECASQTVIGPGLYFPHTGGIVIGAADIGSNCVLYHQVTLGAKVIDMPFTTTLRPSIGNDVTVAAGAKVLGGISIGDGALVGANAVVVKDVPAGATVGGVPAVSLGSPGGAAPRAAAPSTTSAPQRSHG